MVEFFLQQIVNAISLGGIYALLALGLAVVFSIVSLINFAHGELMTVAGYGLFFALAAAVPFPAALVFAVAMAVAAALLTERFAFRPMRKADATGLLLTSFAVSAILRVVSRMAFRQDRSRFRSRRACRVPSISISPASGSYRCCRSSWQPCLWSRFPCS
jgi:branched-subunit amino acid ABC-type transport system permease component